MTRMTRRTLFLVLAVAAVVVAAATYILVLLQPSAPSTPGCEPYTFKPNEQVCISVIDSETKDLSVFRIETSVDETYDLSLLWITWRAGEDTPAYSGTMHFLILYENGTSFDCAGVCFAFGFTNVPSGFKRGEAISEEIAFFSFLADERTRPQGQPYDPSTVNKVHIYFTRDDTLAAISDTVEVVLR